MLSGALVLGSGAYALWQHNPTQQAATQKKSEKRPAALSMVMPDRPQAATTAFDAATPARTPAPASMASRAPRDTPTIAAETARPSSVDNSLPTQPAPPANMALNAPPEPASSPEAPAPASVPQNPSPYANGEFTGPSTDTPWGTVQVAARVQDGAITEIEPIDYPQHRRRSIQINEWALPILEREVIQAQSANVDIVSQATSTSVGYLQSLAGALAQAKR